MSDEVFAKIINESRKLLAEDSNIDWPEIEGLTKSIMPSGNVKYSTNDDLLPSRSLDGRYPNNNDKGRKRGWVIRQPKAPASYVGKFVVKGSGESMSYRGTTNYQNRTGVFDTPEEAVAGVEKSYKRYLRAKSKKESTDRVVDDLNPEWYKADVSGYHGRLTVWEIDDKLYYIGEGEGDYTEFAREGDIVYVVFENSQKGYRGLAMIDLTDDDYETLSPTGQADLESDDVIYEIPQEHQLLIQGMDYESVEEMALGEFIAKYSEVFA